MKRILIMGVCLLISGAAIYGFVDYINTDKKQLDNLYKEEATPVVKKEPSEEVAPVTAVKNDNNIAVDTKEKRAGVKKYSRVKKEPEEDKIFIRVEDFSRARPVRKKEVKTEAAVVDSVVAVVAEPKKDNR